MSPEAARDALLEQLTGNWKAASKAVPPTSASNPEENWVERLQHQVDALRAGRPASFPFFSGNQHEVMWFTVAPSTDDLRLAIENLRAWLIPHIGCEVRVEAGGEESGQGLRPLLFAVSPGGYLVWKTRRRDVAVAADRIGLMYSLQSRRPTKAYDRPPTLYELRQRFRTALLVGDREGAESAVTAIAKGSLDSATNVAFMRVRLADSFGEHSYVEQWDAVRNLVRLRLPTTVRVALVRAFHAHYLAPLESANAISEARKVYADKVEELLGPVLDLCRVTDAPEIARCIAYRTSLGFGPSLSVTEVRAGGDAIAEAILQVAGTPAPPEPAKQASSTVESTLHPEDPAGLLGGEPQALVGLKVAEARGDTRTVQEFGEVLLSSRWEELSPTERERVAAVLSESLASRTNKRLAQLLGEHEGLGRQYAKPPPQDWEAFFETCSEDEWGLAELFLNSDDRPSATVLGTANLHHIIERVESMLTDPAALPLARSISVGALTSVLEDCKSDPKFPRSDHADIYTRLIGLLASVRNGSTQYEDGALFLLLADAVLQVAPDRGQEVVALAQAWWAARPSESLLPFVLDSLSVMSYYGSGRDESVALWVRAAELIRTEMVGLGPSARSAWTNVGRRLGLRDEEIESYLGKQEGQPGTRSSCRRQRQEGCDCLS